MDYPLTAIISDLHGNWPALSVAVADAKARGVKRFVCLGDVVGYGSKPRQCVRRVMQLIQGDPDPQSGQVPEDAVEGFCLQGNHEFALLNSAEDFNPSARQAIDWSRDEFTMGDDTDENLEYWDFLGGLEPRQQEGQVMFAHGSPRDPVREYLMPKDSKDAEKMRANFQRMTGARVCFVGHSHVPAIYFEDGRFYRPKDTEGPYDLELDRCRTIVNVGSVGQPRDSDPRLCYVVWDGAHLTFVRLAYDIEAVQEEIRAVPELPDYLADRLAVGR